MSGGQKPGWDERYAREDFFYGTVPSQFLSRKRSLLPDSGRALAVADGEGRNGVFLAQCSLDVLSVDASAVALAKAQRLAADRSVAIDTRQVDLLAWDWPQAEFDVVAGIFIQFVGPAERQRLFAGLRQALKPGGLLLLHGYRPEQIAYATGGPTDPANLYTHAQLAADFSDFEGLEIEGYDIEIAEGEGHRGLSALIDLVARKPRG